MPPNIKFALHHLRDKNYAHELGNMQKKLLDKKSKGSLILHVRMFVRNWTNNG